MRVAQHECKCCGDNGGVTLHIWRRFRYFEGAGEEGEREGGSSGRYQINTTGYILQDGMTAENFLRDRGNKIFPAMYGGQVKCGNVISVIAFFKMANSEY